MTKRNKELITPELGAALIAIVVSIVALWLVLENKPILSGYKEASCHVIQYEDGSNACIVKMDNRDQIIKVYKAAR